MHVKKLYCLICRDRDRYVQGDYRFRYGYCKHNPRKMVKTWAEKEMRNLMRWDVFLMACLIHILLLTTWQAVAAVLNLLFSLLIFCIPYISFFCKTLPKKLLFLLFFAEEWTYFQGSTPSLVRRIGNALILIFESILIFVTLVSECEQLISDAQNRCSWGFMYWWWNS